MTPFAQLGTLQKSGSDILSTGNQWADLGLDIAAGTNPITGVPYYGTKMIDDFSKGNIASGLGNALWGGLSFVGGAALGKGVLGLGAKLLGRGAAKGVAKTTAQQAGKSVGMLGNAVQKAQQGAQAYGGAMRRGQDLANRQITALGNRMATKSLPMMGGRQLGQRGGQIAANTGVMVGGGLLASGLNATAKPTAPQITQQSAQPTQPTQPAAPDWYTAVTGSSTLPQFQ